MLDRLQFLIIYVGSAAIVALMAACLSSPRVATFVCQTSDADGAQQCEVAAGAATPLNERQPEAVAVEGRRLPPAAPQP